MLVHHRLLVFGLGNTVGIVFLLTVSERMKACIKLVVVSEGYRTGTNKRSVLHAESVTVWGALPLVAKPDFPTAGFLAAGAPAQWQAFGLPVTQLMDSA